MRVFREELTKKRCLATLPAPKPVACRKRDGMIGFGVCLEVVRLSPLIKPAAIIDEQRESGSLRMENERV